MKREAKTLQEIIKKLEENLKKLCAEAGIEDLSRKNYDSLWLSEFSVKRGGKEYPWVKLAAYVKTKDGRKSICVSSWREDMAPKQLIKRIIRVYRALQYLKGAYEILR